MTQDELSESLQKGIRIDEYVGPSAKKDVRVRGLGQVGPRALDKSAEELAAEAAGEESEGEGLDQVYAKKIASEKQEKEDIKKWLKQRVHNSAHARHFILTRLFR